MIQLTPGRTTRDSPTGAKLKSGLSNVVSHSGYSRPNGPHPSIAVPTPGQDRSGEERMPGPEASIVLGREGLAIPRTAADSGPIRADQGPTCGQPSTRALALSCWRPATSDQRARARAPIQRDVDPRLSPRARTAGTGPRGRRPPSDARTSDTASWAACRRLPTAGRCPALALFARPTAALTWPRPSHLLGARPPAAPSPRALLAHRDPSRAGAAGSAPPSPSAATRSWEIGLTTGWRTSSELSRVREDGRATEWAWCARS